MGAPAGGAPLVADIGGTHARFARVGSDGRLAAERTVLVGEHASLLAAASVYLSDTGGAPITTAAIAMAGPVLDDGAELTNGAWAFKTAALTRELGLDRLLVLNDFEALALALPHLGTRDLVQIGGGASIAGAPKVVLGPGTGFGGAVLLTGSRVLPGEIGHTTLPVTGEGEARIAEGLADADGHVPVENAVSGPGLVALYRECARHGKSTPGFASAAEIVAAARARTDAAAVCAVDLFITWLGRVAGNAALLYRADGGVYIGGGMAPKMRDLLANGRLRDAFDRKGRMSTLVTGIPLYIITAGAPGLLGAAAHLKRALGPAASS